MKATVDKIFSQLPSVDAVKFSLLQRTKGDKYIWGIIILLAMISILVVYSATGSLAYKMKKDNATYLFQQVGFTICGFVVIYFLHRANYTIFSKLSAVLFLIAIPLLFYTLFFGIRINESSRWIRLPIVNLTLQTSDFARLVLFMNLSRIMSKKQDVIKDFRKGFLPIIMPTVIICGLIMPANFSTAALTFVTALILMFIGRVQAKHIVLAVGFVLIPCVILVATAVLTHREQQEEKITVAHTISVGRVQTWVSRIQDFMYTKNETLPYQVQQANIAIANGNVIGLGPGNSRQRDFLPYSYADYVYAIIIEEYGLFGGAVVICLYLFLLLRGIRIFRKCPFAFGSFLSLGLSFTLVIQAMANMAVNVNILPVTGLTLPLISRGGSSFLFTCASIGLILSVARKIEQLEPEAIDKRGGIK